MSEFVITGFADEIDPDLWVQLREIKKLNIEYIEMRGVNGRNVADYTPEEMKEIKNHLDSAGIKVSAIGSPIGKIKIEDDFEPHFETFKNVIELAKVLETKYIRLFSFFMDEGTTEQNRDEVMRRMKAFCDFVEGTDIILLHENEKDIYGDTAERCKDIYETMKSDNLKLIFDPANFVQCGVETYPHAYEMLKDSVIYYHIKDAMATDGTVVPSGFGDGHLPEIITDLKKKGYEGFLSLEPHLGHFEGFDDLEGEGDIPEFTEKSGAGKYKLAAESLRNIITRAGGVEVHSFKEQSISNDDLTKVRIGIVGVGNMGTSHAIQLFEGKVKNAELTAICDVKPDRLEWAQTRFEGKVNTYRDFDSLVASGDCDGLIIATPHYDHPVLGIKTLEAGLHVLVEKPIGVYTKAVEELNKVAAASDKVFTIMYNQRTNPVYQKVRELIRSGELGELIRVNWTITTWFRSQRYYDSGGWRATWEGEGGGVLLNQCPHQIDLIQWLCGMPKRVRAFADYGKFHNIEVEDDVTAFFEYENGATGTFITSTGEAPGVNRLEISGDMGRLVVEGGEITFYRNRVGVFEHTRTTEEGFTAPENWVCKIPVKGEETAHVGIMQYFVDGILEGKDQLSPGVEGINGLSLSNAIHMSSWTDDWVEFPVDGDKFYELLQEKINNSTFKKEANETVLNVEGTH